MERLTVAGQARLGLVQFKRAEDQPQSLRTGRRSIAARIHSCTACGPAVWDPDLSPLPSACQTEARKAAPSRDDAFSAEGIELLVRMAEPAAEHLVVAAAKRS